MMLMTMNCVLSNKSQLFAFSLHLRKVSSGFLAYTNLNGNNMYIFYFFFFLCYVHDDDKNQQKKYQVDLGTQHSVGVAEVTRLHSYRHHVHRT